MHFWLLLDFSFSDCFLLANGISQYGETPLHYAATWGHSKCIETLISHGADTNAKDNVGRGLGGPQWEAVFGNSLSLTVLDLCPNTDPLVSLWLVV